MDKPIRVLHVLGTTALGGAESRVMDLYRASDRTRVQFDFAVHTPDRGFFDREIGELGGHVYRLPRFRGYNLTAYQKAWKAFFAAHHDYDCVHGHMTSTASIYLPIARKSGVRLTVAHARSAGVDGGVKGLMTRFLRLGLWRKADVCLAASALAGEAVFGRVAVRRGLVHVVPNAIDAEKYAYDPAKREQMRVRLGLTSERKAGSDGLPCPFVAGHVGRFHPCKNHGFLLEAFQQLSLKQPDSRLLLLGEGDGMDEARRTAERLGISGQVLFMGNQGNAWDYYQAMDCFILPSFYEGLPGTVLEAQTAGLPCVVSDTVTEEAGVTELAVFLPLSDGAERWADEALSRGRAARRSYLNEIRKRGFDVKAQAEAMCRFYETGRLESAGDS